MEQRLKKNNIKEHEAYFFKHTENKPIYFRETRGRVSFNIQQPPVTSSQFSAWPHLLAA